MKQSKLRALLAGFTVLVLLISCAVSGLVLPVSAASVTPSSLSLTYENLWIMTGRVRSMGSSTVTYSDKTTATVAGNAITWKIADNTVATIDTDGLITPIKVGETTITATLTGATDASGNAVTATCVLHVVDGSKYVYADVPHTLGDTEYIANGDFEQGNTYWGKSEKVVAGVGKDGSYGFQLTAAGDGQYYKNAIAVKPNTTYVFSYDYLPGKNSSFYVEGSRFQTGRKTHTYGENATREWQTYTTVFTTSKTMSLSTGWDLVIKATKADPEEPIVIDNISVREYVSALEVETLILSHPKMNMYAGQKQVLTAYSDPYGGNLNDMTWESSNDNVATVSNGYVVAVGKGTATITATARNGVSATCVVTVSEVDNNSLFKNSDMEESSRSMWKTNKGYLVQYAMVDGDRALKLGYYRPVAQTVSGLAAGTTYTLAGSAKLVNAEYLGVTVMDGDTVLFSRVSDPYTLDWDTVWSDEENTMVAPFSEGYTFTTPAEGFSGTVTVIFSVLEEGEQPVTELVTGTNPGTGDIVQGDNDLTDEEDEVLASMQAYLDDLLLYEPIGSDIDLTITDLKYSGDDNGQVTPGTPVTFSVVVKNNGTDPIPVGKKFTVDFSTGLEVVRTVVYTSGVPAGGEVVIAAEPWEAVAGDHMIAARVNAGWDIIETHMEGNNTYQLNLRVAADRLAPTYDNVAQVVQQAGMDRLTLSDDFNSLDTVDMYASGVEGYKWYVTRPWGGTTLTVNDYMVNDGVLTLMNEVPTYGIAFNSVDVKTLNGFRYKHGYLEVRLRIVRPSPNGAGEEGIPAVWSFTQDKALEQGMLSHGLTAGNDTDWVELDWLEYWGITKQWKGGYYTITFHDSTTQKEEPFYSNSNHSLNGLGDAEWHTMGWLWDYNGVRCFLDGVETMNLFWDPDASAVPNASAKTATIENEDGTTTTTTYGGKGTDPGVFSWANEEAAVLYLGGAKDNPLEIDYVRVWQTSEPETVSDNITMDQSELTISEHDRERLTVSVPSGEDAGTLRWKSSDPTVATVHGNGEVYARNAGTAIITATNANGVSTWCTVNVEHNLLTGADFEWDNDLLHKHWIYSITSNASYATLTADPADASNQVLQLKPMDSSMSRYYYNLPVEKGKTYRVTGKYKGTTYMRIHMGSTYTSSIDDLNTASDSTASGWKSLVGSAADANGWKTFAFEFTTRAEPSSWNRNYILAFGNNSASASTYLDDLVMTAVDDVPQSTYTVTVDPMTNGSVTMKANGGTISSGAALTPGTYVDITVAPSSGYQLKLGSLEYAYAQPARDGSYAVTREVLNKNNSTFGYGTGLSFRMVMPAEDVTLSAAFEKISTNTMPAATLGTSVFKNDENDVTGIRFLNRLYVTDWDPNGDGVYVTYNGQKQKVAQFGALLKRSTNTDVELTLENYEAHKSDSSATKIWKSTGCVGENVHLVDYTEGYVDFTIIMTSSIANRYSFLNREYTTCAYVVLEDGTTLYTEAFTDSVLGALERQ